MNTGTYTNAAGEQLTVTKLKYYVSNFVLTNANGTVYTVPQDSCYFLIDESDESTHEPVLHVPEGEYKTVSFLIGVDSLRSTKDISERMGTLDPTSEGGDMYWGWNSGYIFFKMEGTSPASASPGGVFMYHVGGFGGYSSKTLNNLKTVNTRPHHARHAQSESWKRNQHSFVCRRAEDVYRHNECQHRAIPYGYVSTISVQRLRTIIL